VASPDGCGGAAVAGSDATGLFVYWRDPEPSTGGSLYSLERAKDSSLRWLKLAEPTRLTRLVASATDVYFEGRRGVERVSRKGGTPVEVARGRRLLAIDGDWLYVTYDGPDGGTPDDGAPDLRRWSLLGQPEKTLIADGPTIGEVTIDSTHLYFVDSSGGESRIRRLPKSGGAVTTVKSAVASRTYDSPVSNGSALYWRQVNTIDGTSTIVRMNLANGNHVSQPFPLLLREMSLRSSGVYAIGRVSAAAPFREVLWRGDL